VIADDLLHLHELHDNPTFANIHQKALTWYLSKHDPQKYGDSLNVNVDQKISINQALTDARARAEIDVTPRIESAEKSSNLNLLDIVNSKKEEDIFD
jgi:hypothetical protein